MNEPTTCACGCKPELFEPSGGGAGIRCASCGREYYAPWATEQTIVDVWNYRMRGGE